MQICSLFSGSNEPFSILSAKECRMNAVSSCLCGGHQLRGAPWLAVKRPLGEYAASLPALIDNIKVARVLVENYPGRCYSAAGRVRRDGQRASRFTGQLEIVREDRA